MRGDYEVLIIQKVRRNVDLERWAKICHYNSNTLRV